MNGLVDDSAVHARVSFLDRLEKLYLSAVRVLALLGATALLVWAAWFVVSGLYKVSRDAALVKEMPATVSAEDVLAIPTNDAEATPAAENASNGNPAAKKYYNGFVSRYYALYQSKFAPFRQATDTALTRKAFDERYVRSSDRIGRAGESSSALEADKAELEALINAMSSAAAAKQTTDRLSAYKKAKREEVKRTIRSTRTETYCREYGYYIEACIDYGVHEVPQSRTVTESRLPKGVISPPDLFHAYQDRYFSLLAERRQQNASMASAEQTEIEIGNAVGASRLWTAAYIIGAFVSLMFLFLLIAIERHQRRIARTLPATTTS